MTDIMKNRGGGVTPPKARNSNLELYRIITMLLIVAHHYVVNSGLTTADGPIFSDVLSWRSMFLLLFGAWGKTGINCFVLISGYFMCTSRITAKKFFKLLLEVEFYKFVIGLIFLLSGYGDFSIKDFMIGLVPIRSINRGFTGCYLMFYLTIPFLNILIRAMNHKQHLRLLALVTFIYVILGTIPSFSVEMNYVTWFIVLYFIGSYIRLRGHQVFENTKLWGWMTAVLLIASVLSVAVMTWLGNRLGKNGLGYYFVSDSNKILAVLLAISSFLFFKNVKLPYAKWINTVASSTFGVLMIHANSDTMRRWLWQDTLNNVGAYSSPWLLAHAFGSVIGIFVICVLIDQLRIKFIELPFLILLDKHWNSIQRLYHSAEEKISRKLGFED